MLDAVLEAFGEQNTLNHRQLLRIFDGDEDLALSLIDVLLSEKLVTEAGYPIGGRLPLLLNREALAVHFLQSGGFTALYQQKQKIQVLEMKLEKLNGRRYWLWLYVLLVVLFSIAAGWYLLPHPRHL